MTICQSLVGLINCPGDVRPSSRQGTGKSSEDKTSLVLNVESLLNDMNAMDDELQEVCGKDMLW